MTKPWSITLLALGLALTLGSLAAYGLRVSQSTIPADASPQQVDELRQEYGLEGPLALQYRYFSFLFLPGIILLAVYGTAGIPQPDPVHTTFTKIFLVFILFANGVTSFNYLLHAPQEVPPPSLGFWLVMTLVGLLLAAYFSALVLWHGRRWGMWVFSIASFLAFVISIMLQVPVVSACFGGAAPIVLFVLTRSAWTYMD